MTAAPAIGMPATRAFAGAVGRGLAGSALGVVLLPAVIAAPVAAPLSLAPARTVARWEARRLTWMDRRPRLAEPRGARVLGLLGARAVLGLMSGSILGLIIFGAIVAVTMLVGAATDGSVAVFDSAPGQVTWLTVTWFTPPGLILLFLGVSGLTGINGIDRQVWDAFARPGAGELQRQVSRLNMTLADVVAAVDAERRRIERDIHDGVQQRVVALSILLARAERIDDAGQRRELHERARAETQNILDDLRGVAWRSYPAMLARDGLGAALDALRDRTPIPIRLRMKRLDRVDRTAEATAYFVVSESVTNVIKHAGATHIDIDVAQHAETLRLTIHDDGSGGADPRGPGLSGIASRVAAAGGRLRVDSPPGGPTTIEAEIPCA